MKTLATPDVRVAVAERLKRVQPDSRALWGKMTAHGMLCHCADAFRSVFGEKEISPATGLFQRTIMKWVALYAPMSWPKGVPTRPEVQQGAGGTPPGDFRTDRSDLVRLLERFCEPGSDFSGRSHPIFGALSDGEWRRWAYLHLDHHLRQFGQ